MMSPYLLFLPRGRWRMESRRTMTEKTPFFISPAYSVPRMTISFLSSSIESRKERGQIESVRRVSKRRRGGRKAGAEGREKSEE